MQCRAMKDLMDLMQELQMCEREYEKRLRTIGNMSKFKQRSMLLEKKAMDSKKEESIKFDPIAS